MVLPNVTTQSTDLTRLISQLDVSPDGTVAINILDDNEQFTSNFYEPAYTLSGLARRVLIRLKDNRFIETNDPLKDTTLTKKIEESTVSTAAPYIYKLLQIVTLEAFALIFTIEENAVDLKFITKSDIRRVRDNVCYVADYFGTVEEYRPMIAELRSMNIALGYLEGNLNVMMGGIPNG